MSNLFIMLALILLALDKAQCEEVIICRPNNMVSALLYIAEAKDFYSKHELQVKFETTTNAKICLDMLVANRADYMTGAEGPFTYLAASDPPIKIIAMLGQDPETSIFARKDKGIKSFKDLSNKKIAYLPGTVSFFYLARAIKKYGIVNLKLNAMQPPTMPSALTGGAVDAISIWEPWGSQASIQKPEQILNLKDSVMYQFESLLFAKNQILEEKPEIAEKMLLTMIDAENFIKEHQDEAFNILQRAISFDEPTFKHIWPEYKFQVKIENRAINLMKENFFFLKEYDENYKEIKTPDYKSFVESKFLKKLAPDRTEF